MECQFSLLDIHTASHHDNFGCVQFCNDVFFGVKKDLFFSCWPSVKIFLLYHSMKHHTVPRAWRRPLQQTIGLIDAFLLAPFTRTATQSVVIPIISRLLLVSSSLLLVSCLHLQFWHVASSCILVLVHFPTQLSTCCLQRSWWFAPQTCAWLLFSQCLL